MATRPPVWKWYVAYAAAMALIHGVLAAYPFVTAALGIGIYDPRVGYDPVALRQAAVALLVFAPFAVAPFLPKARWAWIYHLVLIVFGAFSIVFLPVVIPLFIYWLRPETKAFFGRNARK